MRWLVLLACACSSKSDCEVVAAKVRPVIKRMMVAAGKPIDDAELDKIADESCANEKAGKPLSASQQKFNDCVLAATGEMDTTACLATEFKAYRDDSAASLERSKARMDKLRAEREELDRELLQTRAALPDAGPADAAIDARPAVDAATLPAWPIPAGVHGKGPEVEVDAIDTDVDRLLVHLWDRTVPLLAPAKGSTVTGRVVAPSQAAAFAALAAQVGFTPSRPAFHGGKAPSVTFDFGGAPARDLFLVLADTMHVNVVVMPGDLPKLDIVVQRVAADAVLAVLAAAVDRTVVHVGAVIYIVAKGTVPPPAPKLDAKAQVSLTIHDGTAADAVAALAAVTKLDYSACGGPATLNLHLVKLPIAEVARAIEFASGVKLARGAACPVAPAKLVAKGARLVAIASAGAKTAAVVAHGVVSNVVELDANMTITSYSVEVDAKTTLYFQPLDLPPSNPDEFAATLKRTSAVIRIGSTWTAIVETATAPVVFAPHSYSLPFELRSMAYTISPKGVELPIDPQHPLVIPLAK